MDKYILLPEVYDRLNYGLKEGHYSEDLYDEMLTWSKEEQKEWLGKEEARFEEAYQAWKERTREVS